MLQVYFSLNEVKREINKEKAQSNQPHNQLQLISYPISISANHSQVKILDTIYLII